MRASECCGLVGEGDELISADDVRTMEIRYGVNGGEAPELSPGASHDPGIPQNGLQCGRELHGAASCMGGPVQDTRG